MYTRRNLALHDKNYNPEKRGIGMVLSGSIILALFSRFCSCEATEYEEVWKIREYLLNVVGREDTKKADGLLHRPNITDFSY